VIINFTVSYIATVFLALIFLQSHLQYIFRIFNGSYWELVYPPIDLFIYWTTR